MPTLNLLFSGNRPAALCAALIAAFFCAAVAADLWLYEDAFFYLRYAYNLAEGYGLVYNPGERYESNTNFLWSILLTPAFWIGSDPVLYVQICGALINALVLWLVYQLAAAVADKKTGIIAVLLTATHWTFFLFTSTGFAPALPSLFVLAALLCARRYAQSGQTQDAAMGGAALALLGMTRLDAALLGAVAGLYVLDALRRAARRGKLRPAHATLFVLMPAAVFGGYLWCKYLYYGDILPATYYAKAVVELDNYKFWDRGVRYLHLYSAGFWLLWLSPLFAYAIYRLFQDRISALFGAGGKNGKKKRRKIGELDDARRLILTMLAIVAAWFGYMLKVGGGVEEFRFMATLAPFLFLALALLLRAYPDAARAAIVVVLIGASIWHGATYKAEKEGDPIPHLDPAHLYQKEVAETLRAVSNSPDDYPDYPRLVTGPGGRIPFFSRLYALEAQGWADARVFEEGNHYLLPFLAPGHQSYASAKLIRELNGHFQIGYADQTTSDIDLASANANDKLRMLLHLTQNWGMARDLSSGRKLTDFGYPPDMLLFEMPMSEGKKLHGLYFTRDSRLDARLAEMQKAGDVILADLAEFY